MSHIDLKSGVPAKWHSIQVAAYRHLDYTIPMVFNDATHTYRVDGQVIPSVTQILFAIGAIPEFSTWNELARDIGTAVHAACALLPDHLDFASVDSRALPYVISYAEWESRHGKSIAGKEVRGYNCELRYCGTCDVRMTSGAYDATLYLQSDGSLPKISEHKNGKADWSTFVSMVNVYNWFGGQPPYGRVRNNGN